MLDTFILAWINLRRRYSMGGRGGDLDISTKSALMGWARNASQIRLASIGENKVNGPWYTEFNQQQDNQRAAQIETFVGNHSVNVPIYRGISNLSDDDYERYTKVGSVIDQRGLSSWTTDKRIATGYGQYGKSIVFIQKGSSMARRLRNLTGTGGEGEVIMGSAARQYITKVEKHNGITYVYTEDKKRRERRGRRKK